MQKKWIRAAAAAGVLGVTSIALAAHFTTGPSFIGTPPANFYEADECFDAPISVVSPPLGDEVEQLQINIRAGLNDGNPETYVACELQSADTMQCAVGFGDGTIANCQDITSPHVLPGPDDYMFMTLFNREGAFYANCDIEVIRNHGQPNPFCRTTTQTGTCNGAQVAYWSSGTSYVVGDEVLNTCEVNTGGCISGTTQKFSCQNASFCDQEPGSNSSNWEQGWGATQCN